MVLIEKLRHNTRTRTSRRHRSKLNTQMYFVLSRVLFAGSSTGAGGSLIRCSHTVRIPSQYMPHASFHQIKESGPERSLRGQFLTLPRHYYFSHMLGRVIVDKEDTGKVSSQPLLMLTTDLNDRGNLRKLPIPNQFWRIYRNEILELKASSQSSCKG